MSTILISGASGEIGHGLIEYFAAKSNVRIVATDIRELDPALAENCSFFQGSILDKNLLKAIFSEFTFDTVFHLAGVLSTGGEKNPILAHDVNVNGSLQLMQFCQDNAQKAGSPVKFLFPSTIAVYGIPSIYEKNSAEKIHEEQFPHAITMYGLNKRYVEELGTYFNKNFGMLTGTNQAGLIDFRAIRFPGIISADTLPTGGTSDYGPEILHAAASGKSYSCFVRKDSRLPFIVMPDAVKALVQLSEAAAENLTQTVYNITSFSPSAFEIVEETRKHFPALEVSFLPDEARQAIVDSWPAYVEDSKARADWGWNPEFDMEKAFSDYLIPGVSRHYQSSTEQPIAM